MTGMGGKLTLAVTTGEAAAFTLKYTVGRRPSVASAGSAGRRERNNIIPTDGEGSCP